LQAIIKRCAEVIAGGFDAGRRFVFNPPGFVGDLLFELLQAFFVVAAQSVCVWM